MNNDASFQDAKRLYLEQYGDPMVTNTYLKIALVLVSLVAIGLALVDLRTVRTFENFRPLVIRIDDLGRAEAINYHNFEYKPQDAEAKYFLSQFCALYYRRNRYTIQNDFAKALYFLDGKLADGILDAYRKDDIIKKFITAWKPCMERMRDASATPIAVSPNASTKISGMSSATESTVSFTPTNGASTSRISAWNIACVAPPSVLPTAIDQRLIGATSISLRKPNSRSQTTDIPEKIDVKSTAIPMTPP